MFFFLCPESCSLPTTLPVHLALPHALASTSWVQSLDNAESSDTWYCFGPAHSHSLHVQACLGTARPTIIFPTQETVSWGKRWVLSQDKILALALVLKVFNEGFLVIFPYLILVDSEINFLTGKGVYKGGTDKRKQKQKHVT